MNFVCYTTWQQLPASARALFERGAERSVFFSEPWFVNMVKHGLEDDEVLRIACVVEGEQVLAVLPLKRRAGESWQTLGQLYSSLFSVLVEPSQRDRALACLAEGLRHTELSALRVAPIAEDDNDMQCLQQALEQQGFRSHRYFAFYNWFEPLNGRSGDAYMAARPSRVRSTVTRKGRKLMREHACRFELVAPDQLARGLADYQTVYRASWKVNEQYQPFIEGLAQQLSKAGWLRLAILYADEIPIAAQFWFLVGRKASIFKLVYDERWKQYSPGSVLTDFLMRHVIDQDKVDEIDFLTGNDGYKKDWMSERRERWGLVFAKPPSSNSWQAKIRQHLTRLFSKRRRRATE